MVMVLCLLPFLLVICDRPIMKDRARAARLFAKRKQKQRTIEEDPENEKTEE